MSARLTLDVADVQAEARDVVLIELRPAGGELPPFEPGAHLEIELPNGMVRHYSLCNDWRERDRYVIGIGRVIGGGGSQYIHQHIRCGMTLNTSAPRNNFALDPKAAGFAFIAGGIGITPTYAMVQRREITSPDRSIAEVLEAHGYQVPNSCREGMCRTCEITVIEGAPDHRDFVLSQDEQRCGKSIMVCASRSNDPV